MTPLTGFQQRCIALLEKAPPTHARHSLRSALHHLEKAELLREIDPAMAAFRAITAEEEAASGVMRCLIELAYPGVDSLNAHDHTHKHAVFPYLEVLELFFGQTLQQHFSKYFLHIKEDEGITRLTLALSLTVNGVEQLAYPIPPLNFGVTDADTGDPSDYTAQINQLLAARGKETIRAFLKDEANMRNRLLYAGPDGYPVIPVLEESFIVQRRGRVLAMINVYLLIYPYTDHQPFVVQALAAFVRLLGQLRRTRA